MTQIAGRYTLEAEIGRGGMGAVWRGTDDVLGRTVALKRIGVAPGGFTPDAMRAEREAKLAAKLNHANVVAVFDLVREDLPDGQSVQWLVMEYVDGTDLSAMIRERGRLSPDEAAPILAQTASALAAAHGAGIVHRDVKPSNILVSPGGQVKLSDFGIARTSGDPALTQTGLVTGSPAYLSPEVASGQQATPASDVWSWGATMFHSVEGHPPYDVGDNLLGALYRIVHEEPPRSSYAGWLAAVLDGTMTRDPVRRWPMATAHDFLLAGPQGAAPYAGLAAIGLAGPARTSSYDEPEAAQVAGGTRVIPLASATTLPPPSGPDGAPPGDGDRPRRPWLLVSAAVLAVVVAIAVAFALGMRNHDDSSGARSTDGTTPTSSPTTGGPSQSASQSPTGQPDEQGMKDFITSYIALASSDPASAFDLLTPGFQQQSGGIEQYEGFWGGVRDAQVQQVAADPATLQVRYRYHYVRDGADHTDVVRLNLAFEGGHYLIASEV